MSLSANEREPPSRLLEAKSADHPDHRDAVGHDAGPALARRAYHFFGLVHGFLALGL